MEERIALGSGMQVSRTRERVKSEILYRILINNRNQPVMAIDTNFYMIFHLQCVLINLDLRR